MAQPTFLSRRCFLVREDVGHPAFDWRLDAAVDCGRLAREVLRLDAVDREEMWALLLSTKNRVIGLAQVSVGTLDASLVHPREVFKTAILANAASVILVHNHPSGDPAPSPEDRQITERCAAAGKILGIPLLDHVIVGRDRIESLRREIERQAASR